MASQPQGARRTRVLLQPHLPRAVSTCPVWVFPVTVTLRDLGLFVPARRTRCVDSPVAGGLGKDEQQLPEAGTPVSRDQREAGHKTNEEKPRNEIPGRGGVLYKALKRPRESRRSRADCSVTRRALGSPPPSPLLTAGRRRSCSHRPAPGPAHAACEGC